MANQQRGEVSWKIGSQRYTLRLTTNAVCELQDFSALQSKAGVERTWGQVLQGIDVGNMKDLRLFFWVALRDHHPAIASDDPASVKAIGDLIDDAGGTSAVIKVITKLLSVNGRGAPDEDEVPTTTRPPDAQVGIGDGSTPTPSPSA